MTKQERYELVSNHIYDGVQALHLAAEQATLAANGQPDDELTYRLETTIQKLTEIYHELSPPDEDKDEGDPI